MADELRETYYMSWRGREGWYIQVPFSRDGKRLVWRKSVSNASYGGTKSSLKQIALALRDEKMHELEVHDPGLGIYHRQKSHRNTSGFVGVRLSEEVRSGRTYLYWEARWRKPDLKIARKVFSISRYGFQRAKQLAVRAREKALRRRAKAANTR